MQDTSEAAAPGLARVALREVAAYAVQGALLPVKAHVRNGVAMAPTVVLVHGHGASAGSFWPLERVLDRAGYHRLAAFAYEASGTLEGVVDRLTRFVEEAAPEGEIVLVGHSMGGILARLWLQERGGAARTRALVTLSTPHGGLRLPAPLRRLALVGELAPDGPVVRRLAAGAGRLEGVACTSIVSRRDHFLWRPETAAFPGAELVEVAHVGHAGVLFSPEVQHLVARRLKAAAPPRYVVAHPGGPA